MGRRTDISIISNVILSISISTVSVLLKSYLLSVMTEKFKHRMNIIYFLIIRKSAIIFMHFSTAFLIDSLFISSNGVLLSAVVTLYIILDT